MNESHFPLPCLTSGSQEAASLGKGGGTVQLEILSAVDGAFLVEMVLDRGRKRIFSGFAYVGTAASRDRVVGKVVANFRPIADPTGHLAVIAATEILQGGTA